MKPIMIDGPLPAEWRVHVGAHKTASTHLQKTLEACGPRIRTLGGAYLPLSEVRPLFKEFPYDRWGYRLARAAPFLRRALLQRRTEGLLAALQRQADTAGPVAFSNEDLLGNTDCILGGRLYPNLAKIHLLAQLGRTAPLRLFLTVRSLDGLLPSAYAESLKGRRLTRADFRAMVDRYAATTLHWTDFVTRLRRAAPGAALEIWNYDDYRKHWRKMHRALLGVSLQDFPEISPPVRTRTPGEGAIAAAERLETTASGARAEAVRHLYAQDIETEASARFDPLLQEEKVRFRRLYEEDLAALDERFPGLLRRSAA